MCVIALQLRSSSLGDAVSGFENAPSDEGKYEIGQGQTAPPPGITNDFVGGNNFMRLTWGTRTNVNVLTYDITDGGQHARIEADFDFRIEGVGDGIGFMLLSTAVYGQKEVVPRAGFAGVQVYQEPSGTNSLGIGFDIHKGVEGRVETNDNHLSVHFDNQLLAEFDAGPIDLNSGEWIHAKVIARPGTNSDVSVVLTPSNGIPQVVISNFVIAGFEPYENRPHWGARSGSFETSTNDIDNVNVQYLEFLGAPPITFAMGFTNVVTVEEVPGYIYVNKLGPATSNVTVDFFTTDGSALAGTHYVATNGTLTFTEDEVIKLIPVQMIDNADINGEFTMSMTLTNPMAGTVIATNDTTGITIVDDDDPAVVGQWDKNVIQLPANKDAGESPIVSIHLNLLPTGDILLWDRHGDAFGGTDGDPWLFDPVTRAFTNASTVPYDLFCAGHALMSDGRLFVPGGHIADGVGEDKAAIYDPWEETWTLLPPMNAGRWYPTVTTLANGDLLVEAGTIDIPTDVNPLPQIWDIAAQNWRSLTTAGAQHGKFPIWANYYPFMYQAPNGMVFCAGPQQMSRYLDISGTGNWTDVAASSLFYRDYGSSVMYEGAKIMIAGGNPPETYAQPSIFGATSTIFPSPVTEVIDLSDANPQWRVSNPMKIGRRHATATLLPDGNVLMTGGSSAPGFNVQSGAALWAEMWDPSTEQWSPLAAAQKYNGYHCNALLLPDGRVITTGGGHPNPPDPPNDGAPNFGAEPTAEIYSPHYLFSGDRPTITSAPGAVTYGETFFVETPDQTNINYISWIKIGNTTHAFNQNQRIVYPGHTNGVGGIWVTAPSDPHLCTPGHYMMFLLSEEGVPSIAAIVRVAMGILSVDSQNDDNVVNVTTVPGNNYQLEYSDSLPTTNWTAVGGPVTATALNTLVTDTGGALIANRFYQVRQVP